MRMHESSDAVQYDCTALGGPGVQADLCRVSLPPVFLALVIAPGFTHSCSPAWEDNCFLCPCFQDEVRVEPPLLDAVIILMSKR